MSVSGLKKSLTIMGLFASVAFTSMPALAHGADGDQPKSLSVASEDVAYACNVLKEELKKPGLAGLMQGFPKLDSEYKPEHFKKVLTEACGFTGGDFAVMPNVASLNGGTLRDGWNEICGGLDRAIHGAIGDTKLSTGLDKIIHESKYSEESFGHACSNDFAPRAAQEDMIPQLETGPKATMAQVEETCDRLIKGMTEVQSRGLIFLFKGDANQITGYNPKGIADTFGSACGVSMRKALSGLVAPQFSMSEFPDMLADTGKYNEQELAEKLHALEFAVKAGEMSTEELTQQVIVHHAQAACSIINTMATDSNAKGHAGMANILGRNGGAGSTVLSYACDRADMPIPRPQ